MISLSYIFNHNVDINVVEKKTNNLAPWDKHGASRNHPENNDKDTVFHRESAHPLVF